AASAAWALALVMVFSTSTRAQAPAAFTPLDSASPPAALAVPISLRVDNISLGAAINEVARRTNVSIVFDPSLAGLARTVRMDVERVVAARVLVRLLDGSPLQAMVSSAGAIVLTARARRDDDRPVVRGIVRQADGPIENVHVALAGTRFETTSDRGGRFTFGA